ncbi:MAG: type II toxin-antitoxin system Phd/YefM family antitoxin [Bdellovibrionaceae bacterium]|nr:type II toxin-antitoxin system Phd/YefM family antitoxin [Pseudobdellovibrionaceae bacterium]
MKKMTSTAAKNNFGDVLTTSQREPVIIEKNGKNVSVVISFEEFQNYQVTVISDRYWGERADKSGKMIGKDKSEEFLKAFGK